MNHDYIFVQKKTYTHLFPNIYVIGKIYTASMKDLFGGSTFGNTLLMMKDGVIYWYASEHGLKEVAEKGLAMIKADPDSARKVREKFTSMAPEILQLAEKLSNLNLRKITNKELWNTMAEYLELYEKTYLWGEPLVLSLNDMLGPHLKKYLDGLTGSVKQTTSYCNLLISCPEKSFVKEEEDALLELAIKIKSGQITNREEAVKKHKEKYEWVPYDYGAYSWDEKYFNAVLDKMLVENIMEEQLAKSRDYFDNLTERQNKLINKLRVDEYHAALFSAMRNANYLLDYKKQVFTILHWKADAWLQEIGKRLGVTKELVQYYLPEEMKKGLVGGEPLAKKVLEDRFEDSIVQWDDAGVRYERVGKAEEYLNQFLKKNAPAEKQMNGVIASAGKCVGIVRVVSGAGEIGKVKKGDVLVASMTTPEYVPAMRKAAAIITDEGGVMCHAAIVSRELGIPCVVGTRNATRVLKDGDMVEVNANHNSVKILRIEP